MIITSKSGTDAATLLCANVQCNGAMEPRYNGNYNNGPKVAVFGFPKDEKLKQK